MVLVMMERMTGSRVQSKYRRMLLCTETLWMKHCLCRAPREKPRAQNLTFLERIKWQQRKTKIFPTDIRHNFITLLIAD